MQPCYGHSAVGIADAPLGATGEQRLLAAAQSAGRWPIRLAISAREARSAWRGRVATAIRQRNIIGATVLSTHGFGPWP